jgi:hypothetical protein
MSMYSRSVVVVACAFSVWLVAAAPALAQSQGNGEGASGQSGSQGGSAPPPAEQPPGEPDSAVPPDMAPPQPAGAGAPSPEQPAASDPADKGGEASPPAPATPEAVPPSPAGIGSAAPPVGDHEHAAGGAEGTAAAPGETPPQTGELSPDAPTQPSGRPFSGMFGGAAPLAGRGRQLDVSGSLYGVHLFKNNLPIVDDGTHAVPPGSTTYAGGGAQLVYGQYWDHGFAGALGTFGESYFPSYKDTDPWIERWGVMGHGGVSGELGRKVSASATGSLSYSPYLQQQNLFLNGPPTIGGPIIGTPGLDFVVAHQPSAVATANSSLSFRIDQRSSVDVYGTLHTRVFTEEDQPSQYDTMAGARYRYRINRYVGVRAGYGLRYARYGSDRDLPGQTSHVIDAGLDGGYGQSYALTRRTTFAFNVGSSIFATDQIRQGGDDQQFDPRTRLAVNASADLLHSWARSWSANLGYRRGVSYEVGFYQPFLSDSAFASVGGLFAQRLDFTASAFYTNGSVGFSGRNNGYATASGRVSLRAALTTNISTYAQYFYYHYLFESGVRLPQYLAPNLDRQGVTVGLSAWLPLLSSRGRP